MSAWQTVNKKSMANMTNEEKMVRAVTQDELAKRGAIVYDSKTGSYTKAKSGENIVFYNEKSYRINGIKTAGIGDKEGKIADADWYYGGKWHPVKNVTILIELAKRRRRKS